MKNRVLLVATIACASFAAGNLSARQDGGPPAARPTAAHELLKRFSGEWETTFKMASMAPGMPPIESHGKEVGRLAMNGLWALSDYEDPGFMGTGFSGHSVLGYDPEKKKYVSVWIDSMSSRLTVGEGTWDEAAQTLTQSMEGVDPMTGKPAPHRVITKFHGEGHRTDRMLMQGPDGKELEMFAIEFRRRP